MGSKKKEKTVKTSSEQHELKSAQTQTSPVVKPIQRGNKQPKKKVQEVIDEEIDSDTAGSEDSDESLQNNLAIKRETSTEEAHHAQDEQYKQYKYANYLRHREEMHREFHSKIQTEYHKFHDRLKELSVEMYEEMRDISNQLLETYAPLKDPGLTHDFIRPGIEKKFKYRESMLTIMFEKDQSIKTLYHIAVASFSVLFMNLILREYKETGRFIDVTTLLSIFNKPDAVFNIWIRVFFAHLLIIPFTRWVHFSRPFSLLWKTIYVAFHLALFSYSARFCLQNQLEFASASIVMCECVRMQMKMHSYLRNKLLYGSDIWKDYQKSVPGRNHDGYMPQIKFYKVSRELNNFIYFHFAPTLIYRDRYIKGPPTQYSKVVFHFVNFFMCILLTYMLFKIFCLPVFSKTGVEPGNWKDFVFSVFSGIVPGSLCMFILFFGLLHSFFNGFAELLQFPDRHFYEDWWNSREFGAYYRRWNIVVHEWLYYYVYLDLMRFWRMRKRFAQILTFLLSAIAHELVLSIAVRFFYPVLMITFLGPGILLIRSTQYSVKYRWLNIVFWILMFIGLALLTVLYSREFYARRDGNVDPEKWGVWYYLAPRSLLAILDKY